MTHHLALRLVRVGCFSLMFLPFSACGPSSSEVADADRDEEEDAPRQPTAPSDPAMGGTGWGLGGAESQSMEGQLTPSSRTCPEGADGYVLPGSGVEYCLAASSPCDTVEGACPLLVTFNTNGAFFSKVPGEVPIIVAELYGPSDGNDVKDQYAELPRLLATVYAGLDRERVFALGWSAGAGAANRGLCHDSKRSDYSVYGSTSDIYAGVLALGGCGCAGDYSQLSGNYHVLTFNGTEDIFGDGDSCEAKLRARAEVNGCDDLGAHWQPVETDDAYAKNGDGTAHAERLHFGDCERGEVVGYRGADEGHVLSFDEHFDPKISGYDTAWRFLVDKEK